MAQRIRKGTGVVLNWTPHQARLSLSTGQGIYCDFPAEKPLGVPWMWPASTQLRAQLISSRYENSPEYELTITGNVATLDVEPSEFLDNVDPAEYEFRIYAVIAGRPYLWIAGEVERND